MKNESGRYIYVIFLAVGYIFLKSSYGKLSEGKFVTSLGDILTKFASKNPYPWFKSFLVSVAIPNSQAFGVLTMWGELFVGITVTLGALYLLFNLKSNRLVLFLISFGFLGGAFLNGIFWLASGWTSPSTDGLNLLMFIVEMMGFALVLNKLFKERG